MIKTKWNVEAVKAYETGQGVELVNEPYPHYVPSTTESEKQEHGELNYDYVICPKCVHQFRAIPENVQRLMIDAGFEPPFNTPQTKEWVGLTDEQIVDLVIKNAGFPTKLAKAIESKLKKKNNG